MKHTLRVTMLLLSLFIMSQAVGLYALNVDLRVSVDEETGISVTYHPDTAIGPRPDTTGASSLIYILIAIAIGTALLLLLIRFKKVHLWKLWFFLAVWMTVTIFFGVFTETIIAGIIALALALLKIFRPNPVLHNITEVFMYSGIAILLVPILSVFWISVLLVVIAVYDFIAVYKSRHMVSMAEFQTKTGLFAGLSLPYSRPASRKVRVSRTTRVSRTAGVRKRAARAARAGDDRETAILGGGDIAFPLIFSGVVMERMVNVLHYAKEIALLRTFIITLVVAIGLLWLFMITKKGKFYPAMPVITLACFAGYGVLSIINAFS